MERAIEIYALIQFLIIGLSHVLQPRAWVDFFIILRQQGHAGVFANGFLSLIFGALVVAFHNVWTGWGVVLTVIGWGQLIKASIAFVLPGVSMHGLQRVSADRAWEFQLAGAIFVALAGLMLMLLLGVGVAS